MDPLKTKVIGIKMTSVLLFALGHTLTAFGFYFNHRFVLHGKLGKLPLLKNGKRLHALHHANPYGKEAFKNINIPSYIVLLIFSIFALCAVVSIPLALGCISMFFYYEIVHRLIHSYDDWSFIHKHHKKHHENPRVNFSGTQPWIDRIFNTMAH